MSDSSKERVAYVEKRGSVDEDEKRTANAPQFTPEQEKAVWSKVDRRLMPVLALLYLFSFLDRGAPSLSDLSYAVLTFIRKYR